MNNLKQLYETDLNLWLEKTISAIQDKNYEAMDWDNLLEEIEDMVKSQKRALRSYYYRLVEHILELRYWHNERERNKTKWKSEVINFRREIKDILEDSPSLKNYLHDNHAAWFTKAVEGLGRKGQFSVEDTAVIPLSKMLDDDFFGISQT